MTEDSAPAELARGAVRLTRRFARKVKTAAEADGAGRSGLAALISTHALSSAGDAMVAVALASSTFFSVDASAARGKIALYLLLTLLPFSLLIPVAAPILDRFPHGRRNVLAVTGVGRGLLAWTLAGSLASFGFYVQAMVVLVLQRAYSVARAAAVVRVRPPSLGLVAANARMNVASLAGSGVAATVGVLLAKAHTSWDLRAAAVVYLVAGAAAFRLPSRIDDAEAPRGTPRGRFEMRQAPQVIRRPLVATITLRAATGLTTLGLAVLLKAHHAGLVTLGLVIGAGAAGGLVGTALASRLPASRVARVTALALLAPMAAGAAATVAGTRLLDAVAVGSVGLGASLGKYALDAAIQSHVDASQIGSAFAKSETSLQLAWAVGGGLGLLISLLDGTGLGYSGATRFVFAVVTAIPVAGLVYAARHRVSATSSRPSTRS